MQVETNKFSFKVSAFLFNIYHKIEPKLKQTCVYFNLKNVFTNARQVVDELARLKAIVNKINSQTLDNDNNEQLAAELVALINGLRERLEFLKRRKSVRLLKRRLISIHNRSSNASKGHNQNDELIDFKLNEFFQTEQLFGTFKKFDQNIEEQVMFLFLWISILN